jgi:hypothetical protein
VVVDLGHQVAGQRGQGSAQLANAPGCVEPPHARERVELDTPPLAARSNVGDQRPWHFKLMIIALVVYLIYRFGSMSFGWPESAFPEATCFTETKLVVEI